MNKYFRILPIIIGAVMALGAINRELWFDEALTLLNFVLPLELEDIYFAYTIPNNQIVYSMMLKVWNAVDCGALGLTQHWRLLSLLCSLDMLGILINLRRKLDENALYPAILVLSAMCVSSVFINYATALRGYAASWLFCAMALSGLYDIFHEKAPRGWLIYLLAALLAVGTVPTNLLMLTGALIYALPWMREKFWQDKRFYCAAAAIPASLIIFYMGIAGKFLDTFKLGEGFASCSGATVVTLGMYGASFGLLLPVALLGIKTPSRVCCLRYTVWLLPFAAIWLLHRAPFPRVFVTVLPVLAMLVIDGIKEVVKANWRKYHKTAFFLVIILFQFLLIPTGAAAAYCSKLSSYEDDFFHPWYMLPNYRISESALQIRTLAEENKVFISFASDPAPLYFYIAERGGAQMANISADLPYNSVKNLADGSVAVLRHNEDKQTYEKRFNCRLQEFEANKLHKFYRVKLTR